MISKKNIIQAIRIPCLLVLIYPATIAVGNDRIVPIVVRAMESKSDVPSNWTQTHRTDTFKKMQEDLQKAVVRYFGDFWDVVPNYTTLTKITVTVKLVDKGLSKQEYYYSLKLLVEHQWSGGQFTDDSYYLVPDSTWCDPALINTVEVTPSNVVKAFRQFLNTEFLEDSDEKEKFLMWFMKRAPVGVNAWCAKSGPKTWLLPFPKHDRYDVFKYCTFTLRTRRRGYQCERLIVKANGERLTPHEDPTEPLKAVLKGAPDTFKVDDYKGAFIYMSPEDFDIETF